MVRDALAYANCQSRVAQNTLAENSQTFPNPYSRQIFYTGIID